MSIARIREIAQRCQRNYGISVAWQPGWERRGNGMSPNYSGGVVHHTATGLANSNLPVLVNGRSDLSGPLCNFCTWADGTLGVIAAFPANHAGASGGYNTAPLPVSRSFNAHVIGNEIIYPGTTPMTPAQYRTATILSATIAAVCGAGNVNRIKAHAETSITGKWDPGNAPGRTINMNAFRRDVAAVLAGNTGGGSTPTPSAPHSSLSLLENAMERFTPAQRGTLSLGIPERDLSLQVQVAGAANTPPSELKVHRIAFIEGNGRKRTLDINDPVVPAGDPWQGDWLNARPGECSVLIEYSYTGDGASVHTATASFRRAY